MTDPDTGADAATRKHLRGSSLLLGGRVLSMGLNFVTQVLIVRTLSKTDFGAFAYALAIASFVEPLLTLGLNRGATRFLSIYEERRDYGRLVGTLVLGASVVLSLGLGVTLLVVGFGETIGSEAITDAGAIALLSILIVLAPIDALDGLIESVFAVFARPKAIFVRKHVVAPGLRLAVVALLVVAERDAQFLALGYVLAGAAGLLFYGVFVTRILRQRGIIGRGAGRGRTVIPVREVLGFTISLLSVDLVFLLITTSSTVLLGRFSGVAAVALYQAVLTPARLNYRIVTSSFTLLFTPSAARLHERGDRRGLENLYWQTTAWIAVLSAPIFILTFSFAESITETLYGRRYAAAAPVMAILALGYYVNAALGFNGHTLQVAGHVRTVLWVNISCAAINIALAVALTPAFGAVGAAVATSGTLLVQNALNQAFLVRKLGISLIAMSAARVYLRIAAVVGLLFAVQALADPHVAVSVILAGSGFLVVCRLCRTDLDMAATFPELGKLPGAKLIFPQSHSSLESAPPARQKG